MNQQLKNKTKPQQMQSPEPQTTPHKQKQNTVNQLTALPLLSCYNSDFRCSFLNLWVHTGAGILRLWSELQETKGNLDISKFVTSKTVPVQRK